MREIKFRAWDNVKDRMYYAGEEDDVVFTLESGGIVAVDITEEEDEFAMLHHLEYMQFTGLKDKNGREIYEGDILKCRCRDKKKWHLDTFDPLDETEYFYRNSILEWWQSHCNLGYRLRDGKGKTFMIQPSSLATMDVEVIGNIYENPELLEV